MIDFPGLVQQGMGNLWVFIPSATLLGALHGLEPGHAKTVMAAFIIAIRGTLRQAVWLGLAATISHTAVVWVIALGGMYLSRQFTAEAAEPYFHLISAIIILTIAMWMLRRTWIGERRWRTEQTYRKQPLGQEEPRLIDTGHGRIELSIARRGTLGHWRVKKISGQNWAAKSVQITTLRDRGAAQVFTFEQREDYLESVHPVPKPHRFTARVTLGHGGHFHEYDIEYPTLALSSNGGSAALEQTGNANTQYQDAHQQAHANDIKRRFADQSATTGQIILFGLTGGLIPCPAAITVLLLCIQVKALTMGAVLVLCFSLGLALTLVSVGMAAAFSVRQALTHWSGLDTLVRRAPYLSSLLMAGIGIYMAIHGWTGLMS